MKHELVLSLFWILFYLTHSLLAADRIKKVGVRVLGSKQKYRLFYSIVSSILFAWLILLMILQESRLIFTRTREMIMVSLVLSSYGILILRMAFRFFSIFSFLGVRKEEHTKLVTEGVHGKVRHPVYAGTILLFLGAFLFNPTVSMGLSVLWLIIYLPIGIYLEERKLIGEFGDAYVEYKKKVKAIIPRIEF